MKDLNMKKSKSKRHPVQALKQKRSFAFLNSKSGEGYVDVAVTVMIVAFVLVFAVNVVSLVALNQNLKTVSDQITDYATLNGTVAVDSYAAELKKQTGIDFGYSFDGSQLYDANGKVQLGDRIICTVTYQLTKEVPTSVFFDGLPPRNTEGISFGLYQSLYGYLPGIEADQFDVVIVDEAHHALAHGFRTCLEHLTPKFLIGMTATPWRGDGQSLTSIFGDPIAKVSLVDGMAMGYLSQVDYRILCDNLDWDNMGQLSKQNLSIRDLNKRLFLPQRDDAVISQLQKVIKDVPNPRIAIFSPSIEHSNRFAEMLSASGIPCAALSRVDKAERRRRLMAFASGSYQAICAVDVMNEGIDIPDVNILVFLRATHSRRIFVQQLGRGLRLSDGKEKVIVLDFVSDIRRMAEMIEMNQEGKQKGAEKEVLYLKEGFVSFSNAKVESFVNAWLEDVADLSGSDDEVKLTFPEGF